MISVMFDYIPIIMAIPIIIMLIKYIYNNIKENGFLCNTTFLMIMILFYFVVPFIYLINKTGRDSTTAYNLLLQSRGILDITLCILFCSILIALFLFFYKIRKKKGRIVFMRKDIVPNLISSQKWYYINNKSGKKIQIIADISLFLGGLSILMCIFSVGGIDNYLALGSQARGIDKSITDYISASMLPLITLSGVILVAPYLYSYLISFQKKSILLKVKFGISFLISILYLLYNQGRLPLLLFLVPFIFNLRIFRKAKISSIIIITIMCVFALEPLSNLFTYLTYGQVTNTSNSDFFSSLLLEFTYPFSNFLNCGQLVDTFGMRLGVDYVQWPLTIVPSSILNVFQISKAGLETIGVLNTSAYGAIVGFVSGGIPADFLTFNYYQFGLFSVFLSIPIVAMLIRSIDIRIMKMRNNHSVKIIVIRVCFLLISLVNNFDLAVIFRMRFDLIILIYVLFFISKKGEDNYEKTVV